MNQELVGKYLSREDFESDTDFAISQLKRFTDAMETVTTGKKALSGASTFNGVADAAEIGVKANARLAESVKAVNAVVNQRFASEAKLVTVSTDYNKATVANNIELQKQNKELKDQVAYNNANTGSIEKARAAVRLLNTERNQLNLYTEEGQAKQAKLNEQIDKYNAFVKKSVDALSQQKINIGNYQGSAKIIVDALEKEKEKLNSLQASYQNYSAIVKQSRTTVTGFGGGPTGSTGAAPTGSAASPINTAEVKQAEAEMIKLEKAIEQTRTVVEGFSRVTEAPQFLNIAAKTGDANKELKLFTKTLIDLERQGQGNSEAAIQLRKHLAELTDEIGDAKAEIKALSSDTRGFDLFAGSVSFAADAFQLFAGAAVLAGASEEDAAEATKTLTAVQSVANGVKGIANELTTRGTAANKLYAFSQAQIKIAMDTTASAGVRLRAVLATLGFGALIIGVGLLIANFSKIKDALTGVTDATKRYQETLKDYEKGATEAAEKTNKVKLAFQEAKAGVISKDAALKIYNDTLGDTFGKANSLAEAEKLYNEKAGTYIQIMGLKAQANALFAKSAEAAAKGLTAGNSEDSEVSLLQKFKLSLTREAFFTGITDKQLADQKAANAKAIKEIADADAKNLFDQGAKIATQADQYAKDIKINLDPEKAKKTTTKKDDTALKDALEAEKKKNAAIRQLAIENANELIRINQLVVDNENSSLKDKVLSLGEISKQRKLIASIEFAASVENETKIEKGKRVEIEKSQEEILLAKTKFNNQARAIDQAQLDATFAAQKANTAKILAELAKEREEKLKALDEITQAGRDRTEKERNDRVIGLDDQFNNGTLSLEKYNKARAKVDIAYHVESLVREIKYQKDLLAIVDLPQEKKAEALRALSNLEMELADAVKDNHVKNEEEKLAATQKTFDTIQNTANTVFGLIDGLLNANQVSQKNKIKQEQDDAEKKAARDIDIINASADAEETKAAKVALVNARLQAQKDQFAQREKQSEMERARFQKATTIFNILLATTLAVIKAYTEGDPYTKVARAFIAGAAGAAQLAIAIATPIPKYFKGKKRGEAYEGPAMVNDHPDGRTMEVIERADGSIEMPQGRNVITHVGKNDVIHPSVEQWRDDILNAAYRDAHRMMRSPSQRQEESFESVMNKHTKQVVAAIQNKPDLHLGSTGKGMEALWRWGASQAKYTDENTNWR